MSSLSDMPRARPALTRAEKTRDAVIGVILFLLLNIAPWMILAALGSTQAAPQLVQAVALAPTACLFLNLIVLVVLAFVRPWIAVGMLGTIGALMALALLAGVLVFAACFVSLARGGY